jgi:FAD dependent oxidoreductase TIGR03364
MSAPFDLAVVGAGICGLAHALAAARRGRRVVVIDRDAAANGASIRNFGFVTVTGQQAGDCWRRAMRSRDVWAEIAPQAGIESPQKGLLMVARRPEALAVLEQFAATDMGAGCRLVSPGGIAGYGEGLRASGFAGALYSPHEMRVESATAIPKLAAWLAERHGVTFLRETAALSAAPPRLETSRGPVEAEAVVVCPGDDFHTLHADRIAAYGLTRCKLHMMRLKPEHYDTRLPVVMSDLGMVRYLGYSELPAAAPLRARLEAEQAPQLEHGVHLIVARSADGSLVVGDSHHYGATPDPFAPSFVDELILEEYAAVYEGAPPPVAARWTGTYASAKDRLMLMDKPSDALRIVLITSGTGASTSFAIAEETIADLYGAS